MELIKIEQIPLFESKSNLITLKFKEMKEPNRSQELVYFSLLFNGSDITKKVFSLDVIQCNFEFEKTVLYPSFGNYFFVPYDGGYLININTLEKHNLKVLFTEDETFQDAFHGNFFYENHHLTINKRSIVITDLNSLLSRKIKLDKSFNIEWCYFVNPSQLRVLNSFSQEIYLIDIITSSVINSELLLYNQKFFRFIYKGQKEDVIYIEQVLKKDTNFISNYFKII